MAAAGAAALNLTWLRPDWIRRPAQTASGRGIELSHGRKIAVIGLGYVGLPVAVAFARSGVPVVGFDIEPDPHRGAARRPRPHPRGRSRRPASPDAALRKRPGGARRGRLLSSSPCRRRSTRRAGPISARCCRPRETVGGVLKRGDIVVYESTVYPGAVEEDCVPVLEHASGLEGGHGFHRRLFARAHQPRRQGASLRDHHQGGVGTGRGDARHRRRGLRLGGQGRHPSRAVDQGRRSRQGDREHAARPQHRLHERTVGDLRRARHRHRRRAGRGAHQVELPAVHAGSGRRPLHRRRSVLSDASRREGRLPSRR